MWRHERSARRIDRRAGGRIYAGSTYVGVTTTDTIPAGASYAEIELWADTGSSGLGNATGPWSGGSGGSGSYGHSKISVVGQSTKTFAIALAIGDSQSTSTISAGTVTGFTTITVNGGKQGTNATASSNGSPGAGGAAGSGGTLANTAGNAGGATLGGAAVPGVNGSGNPGANSTFSTVTRNAGQPAVAVIKYT